MKITRQNYQEIFLDFFEGRLNQSQIDELMAFLESNPDLKEEFDGFESITLYPSPVTQHFDYLKKNINDLKAVSTTNFEEACVAYFEGDLNSAHLIEQLKELVKHDQQYNKAYQLYSKTKLKPDETISFTSKEELKHYPSLYRRTNLYVRIAVMAASVAILIGTFIIFNPVKVKNPQIIELKAPIAENTETQKNTIHQSISLNSLKNNTTEKTKNRIQIQDKPSVTEVQKEVNQNQHSENHISLAALESKTAIISKPVLNKDLEPAISFNLNKIQFEAIENQNELYSFSEKVKTTFNQLKNNLFGNQNVNAITDKGVEQLTRLLGAEIQINFDRDSVTNRKIIKINAGNFNYYSSVALK